MKRMKRMKRMKDGYEYSTEIEEDGDRPQSSELNCSCEGRRRPVVSFYDFTVVLSM